MEAKVPNTIQYSFLPFEVFHLTFYFYMSMLHECVRKYNVPVH
jgi:hypothetical protein